MKAIAKISTISIFCASLFASSLNAQCININKADVNWTSFKTLSKIGVSGTFKDVKLETKTNASTKKEALLNSSVKINMKKIDAKADIKTNNILKYFVANLENELFSMFLAQRSKQFVKFMVQNYSEGLNL